MTETEEAPVLSFKERLAKFNQPEEPLVPRPRPQPASRPPPVHSKTVNNPPSNVNGSVADRSIGNQPAPQTPKLNIENNYGNGQNGVNGNGVKKAKPPPPPLPSRRPSTQQLQPQAPAPPDLPRRPSSLQRGVSQDSVTSDVSSLSAVSARTAPPLPSRRGTSPRPPPPPPRPQSQSNGTTNGNEGQKPPLPHRPASNASTLSNRSRSPAPTLPPRLPPRTPTREQEPAAQQQNGTGDVRPPTRRLPPPSRTIDARLLGFGGSKKSNGNTAIGHSTVQGHPSPNGIPPPVPRDSRPDLSKIEASKPRITASPSPAVNQTTTCLKCRDFSAPDEHAAQFPRQSLPTHDLSWLANALTAPFPSPTDKARAIFTWLHHNVEYDVYALYNNCVKPSTPQSTLATGLAVCEGYAGLFAALATHAGLEVIVVGGHGKGTGYADPAPGSALPPYNPSGHAWNAVRIDNGHWKLIDACWGAGAVNGGGQPYIKVFSPSHFTKTNDEFGQSHYPSNRDHFFRDDGRSSISWEEYLLHVPKQPLIFTDAHKHNLDPSSFYPATNQISVNNTPSPLRFQFNLICPHWTFEHHSKAQPGLFLLQIHGIDGRKEERLPFNHVRGSTPGGGGDVWYVDIPDARMLGAPGQKLQIAVLTSFGDRTDARGVTVEEFKALNGRVGMAWAYVCQWDLM